MRILITGGAAYIGTELITLLCKNKTITEIVCLDNFSRLNYGVLTQPALNGVKNVSFIQYNK